MAAEARLRVVWVLLGAEQAAPSLSGFLAQRLGRGLAVDSVVGNCRRCPWAPSLFRLQYAALVDYHFSPKGRSSTLNDHALRSW